MISFFVSLLWATTALCVIGLIAFLLLDALVGGALHQSIADSDLSMAAARYIRNRGKKDRRKREGTQRGLRYTDPHSVPLDESSSTDDEYYFNSDDEDVEAGGVSSMRDRSGGLTIRTRARIPVSGDTRMSFEEALEKKCGKMKSPEEELRAPFKIDGVVVQKLRGPKPHDEEGSIRGMRHLEEEWADCHDGDNHILKVRVSLSDALVHRIPTVFLVPAHNYIFSWDDIQRRTLCTISITPTPPYSEGSENMPNWVIAFDGHSRSEENVECFVDVELQYDTEKEEFITKTS